MPSSERMHQDRRPLWRSAAMKIAAAGRAASTIGAAIKESVLDKLGSVTRP